MALRHPTLATLVAALGVAVAAAPARADMGWLPCSFPGGFECGELQVPLDRSGSLPGAITLRVRRRAAALNPERTALLALPGGPGQAALPLATDFANALDPALFTRDLLVFDARGTGASGALRCSGLTGRSRPSTRVVRRCAAHIGPARGFYRTADTVEDIEALRRQAGYERLALFGVSYGTKVALAYAARYPDRVESIVLDSVVLPEGPDPFRRSSLRAVPRVLRQLCGRRACARITPNVARDLAALTRRLERRPLRGRAFAPNGRPIRTEMSQADFIDVLLAGDFDMALRSDLPGAIRAALTGDVTPLLRLSAIAMDGPGAYGADSDTLFVTTTCEETVFKWTREAPSAQRAGEIAAVAHALPQGATGLFSPMVALDGGAGSLCVGWPIASPAPGPPAPLPDVPTLILAGAADLRTPLEDARALVARIAGAQLVRVPHLGHSVLGTDTSGCAQAALAAFFEGRAAAACRHLPAVTPPAPRPPAALREVTRFGRVPGRRGRTLTAVVLTVGDAARHLDEAASPAAIGGLRGGFAKATEEGIRFAGFSYVPGVEITGLLPDRGPGRLRIRGRSAVSGVVRIDRTGLLVDQAGQPAGAIARVAPG